MALKCPFCGFTWVPKVEQPRACPSCKRYFRPGYYPESVDISIESKYIKDLPEPDAMTLPGSAMMYCAVCGKIAVFRVINENVCEEHALELLKMDIKKELPRRKTKTKKKDDEVTIPFDEFITATSLACSRYEDFVEIVTRESARRGILLHNLMDLCQAAWNKKVTTAF